jgi:beta-barrel assembly-enhancing protease
MKKGIVLSLCFFLFALAAVMPSCQGAMISEAQEIQIGAQGAAKLESQYGTVNDPEQLARIHRIGQSLVNGTERRNLRFTFKILNTQKINALAFPGGFVYVTRGILPLLTDQELTFVLGHEITHVVKKHAIHQIEKRMYTDAGLVTLAALLNQGKVSQGSMNTVNVVSTVISNSYSREDEHQADMCACEYMVYQFGTSPRAGISFMRKLQKAGGSDLPGFVNSIIGDHPLTEERIRAIDEKSTQLGYK